VSLRNRVGGLAVRYAYALALVARAFTVGILTRRGRHLIGVLARENRYRSGPAPILPLVSIEAVTNAQTRIALPFTDAVDGNVSLLELIVLARIAREVSATAVFEIGTFNGRTTATLAVNTPDTTRVLTLDLPRGRQTRFALAPWEHAYVDKSTSGALFQGRDFARRIEQLVGDSAVFDFAPYTAELVFVDGSHAYEYVRSDSERAIGLLPAQGGVVLWHDYGEWEGVTRALNELHTRDARFTGLRHIDGTTLAILDLRYRAADATNA
jgi:predicted O-methyltransferase YrrM